MVRIQTANAHTPVRFSARFPFAIAVALLLPVMLGFTIRVRAHEFEITIDSDPQGMGFQLNAETAKGSIHYPFFPGASAFGSEPHTTPLTGGIDGAGTIYYLPDRRIAAINTGRYLFPGHNTSHDMASTVAGGAGKLAGVYFEVNDRGDVENIAPPDRADWDGENRILTFKYTRVDFAGHGTQVGLFLITNGPDPTFWTPHGYETLEGPDPFYPFEFNPAAGPGISPRYLLPNNPDVAKYVIVAHNDYAPVTTGPPFDAPRDGLPWSGKGNGQGVLSFSIDDEGSVYDVTQIQAGTVIEEDGWYCIHDGAGKIVGMRVLAFGGNADGVAADMEDVPGIRDLVQPGTFANKTKKFTGRDKVGDWAVSFGDFNDDGYVDMSTAGTIYLNVQGKRYKQILEQMSTGVWGDVNNDGHLDYVRSSPAGDIFYGDGRGRFQGGPAPGVPATQECTAVSLGDINNDGLVDIYYCGGSGRADTLWRQDPDNEKKWVRVLEVAGGYARSAVGCDFDEDKDIDFYVSNYWLTPNWMWISDGQGGAAQKYDHYNTGAGNGHSIGACWGDVDNDGYFDIFAGNFAHPGQPESRFLRNLGPAAGYKFEEKGQCGVAFQESYASPTLGDYDNDGDLDLFFTTVYGHNAARLYRNDGDASTGSGQGWKFTDVTGEEGIPRLGATYQAAWADVDNDGDLDLLTAGKLFINKGNDNHWLKIRLEGDGRRVNRSAIGTRVRIKIGKATVSRQVEGGGVGQGNQNDPTLHFGLGRHAGRVRYEVTWTNGRKQTGTTRVDRVIRVKMK